MLVFDPLQDLPDMNELPRHPAEQIEQTQRETVQRPCFTKMDGQHTQEVTLRTDQRDRHHRRDPCILHHRPNDFGQIGSRDIRQDNPLALRPQPVEHRAWDSEIMLAIGARIVTLVGETLKRDQADPPVIGVDQVNTAPVGVRKGGGEI